jgi:ferritin-like metal-binding protein YciE
MCRYGTLIAWAEELGHDEIVRFLTTNLNEEKAANTKLNTVALRKGVKCQGIQRSLTRLLNQAAPRQAEPLFRSRP